MEKVIQFLGGRKNDSDRTGVFDMPELLKTLLMALLTFGSLTFTAGTYFGNAKDLPDRVMAIERKVDKNDTQHDAILSELHTLSTDMRELRNYMLREKAGR